MVNRILLGMPNSLLTLALFHDCKNDLICLRKEAKTVVFLSVDGGVKQLPCRMSPKENAKAVQKVKNVVLGRSCLLEIMLE